MSVLPATLTARVAQHGPSARGQPWKAYSDMLNALMMLLQPGNCDTPFSVARYATSSLLFLRSPQFSSLLPLWLDPDGGGTNAASSSSEQH